MTTSREKKAAEKARTKRDAPLVIAHERQANAPKERARRDAQKQQRVRGA